jgi:hypothetical protein
MDYSRYAVNDFLTDDYFLRWVNQNDPEAEKFWKLYVTLHPETKATIERAREIALKLKETDHMPVLDVQVDQLWSGIQQRIETPQVDLASIAKTPKKFHWQYGIAASLILGAIIFGTAYFSTKKEVLDPQVLALRVPMTEDFVEEVNNTQSAIRIHLNDGSIVSLAKGSRLKYRTSYEGEESRHVFLTGEAFFDISKDPRKPFFVHANEVVTKVLGTSFNVKAYSNENNVTVAVRSGKVSVFSPKTSNAVKGDIQSEVEGVVLLPNQQVIYQRQEESFDKTLVETPVILSKEVERTDFTFENESIPQVFKVLQEAYGIEIIFDEEVMKGCFITAPLGSEPLFEKLKVICRTIGASYEIMDSKVVINSTGCQ